MRAAKGSAAVPFVGWIAALLDALIAFRLPEQKIKAKGEGVEQVVRDSARTTTVAKLQFEMDDPPTSSDSA